MLFRYQQTVDESLVRRHYAHAEWDLAFELLAQPLQRGLWELGSFDAYRKLLSPTEDLILCLDYVQSQVGQGGFIQLFQNGYAPVLMWTIEKAQSLSVAAALCSCMDEALQIFVPHYERLQRECNLEEFARLYDEFPVFEILEARFRAGQAAAIREIIGLVLSEDRV